MGMGGMTGGRPGPAPALKEEDSPRNRAAALSLAFFLDTVGRPVRLPPPEISPVRIWDASSIQTALLLGLRPREVRMLPGFRSDFSVERAEADLSSRGIAFVARGEKDYPQMLARIFDPPVGIFVYRKSRETGGLEEIFGRPRIAIVGARAASRYGIEAAGMLAAALSESGVCVVSGMALGIDAAAHRGSLEGAGGSIAVLGGGVDVVYPSANRALHGRLAGAGAIISEYPPGSRPRPWRFPARNRIIAGISRGVVVVEGREGSGSLITADFCLEQGGDVFAVPGSIFSPLSDGPLRLIREGAAAVSHAGQVLESLGLESANKAPAAEEGGASRLSGEEEALCRAMDGTPRAVDTLAARAGIGSSRAAAALVAMELKGLVRFEPGRGYSR